MGDNRFEKIDPALNEATMLAEEQKVFDTHDPVDSANQLFSMYSPKYRQLIKTMPRNALTRLAVALVEGALSEVNYKPTTAQERMAYVLGDKLMQARWVMQLHTLSKIAQEVEDSKLKSELTIPGAVNQGPGACEPLQTAIGSVTMDTTNSNEGENHG